MRLPLAMLEVFNAIAQEGSLRGAAEALGLKPSSVSHQLKNLEERIGTPLFIRTTRSVSLTEAGRALARSAAPAFEQLADGVESARSTGHEARGTLKLVLPEFVFDLLLRDHLPTFQRRYPEITVELLLTDALSNILDEGRHAGFRLGGMIAQDMVATRLTEALPTCLVASPNYLAHHPMPQTPEDLLTHNCLRYRFPSSGQFAPWLFKGPEGDYPVEVVGTVTSNSVAAMMSLAERDMGIAYAFRASCARPLADGRLIEVLPDQGAILPGVHIYYPQEYRNMVPLKLFISHLKAHPIGR